MFAQRAGIFGVCVAVFSTIFIVLAISFEDRLERYLLKLFRGNEKLMIFAILATVVIASC